MSACVGCGHRGHEGRYCSGWSECDDECLVHECACSWPDPDNFASVPARRVRRWFERRRLTRAR